MLTPNGRARGAAAVAAGFALAASAFAADVTGAGATYVLAYQKGADPVKQKGVIDFFMRSLRHAQKMATEFGFVPLPPNVVQMVEAEMRKVR